MSPVQYGHCQGEADRPWRAPQSRVLLELCKSSGFSKREDEAFASQLVSISAQKDLRVSGQIQTMSLDSLGDNSEGRDVALPGDRAA